MRPPEPYILHVTRLLLCRILADHCHCETFLSLWSWKKNSENMMMTLSDFCSFGKVFRTQCFVSKNYQTRLWKINNHLSREKCNASTTCAFKAGCSACFTGCRFTGDQHIFKEKKKTRSCTKNGSFFRFWNRQRSVEHRYFGADLLKSGRDPLLGPRSGTHDFCSDQTVFKIKVTRSLYG